MAKLRKDRICSTEQPLEATHYYELADESQKSHGIDLKLSLAESDYVDSLIAGSILVWNESGAAREQSKVKPN